MPMVRTGARPSTTPWSRPSAADVRPLPLVAAYRSRRRPWPVMIGVLNDRMARYPGVAAHDHTGGGRVVGEYVTAPILDVDMVGHRRRDLFIDYFAAIERHEITAPRVEPFYSEHRFLPRRRRLRLRPSPRHRRRHGARVPRLP